MENGQSNFQDFCTQTSLHGWIFLGHGRVKSCKVFWIVTICVTFGLGMFWIGFNTKEFLDATVDFDTLSLTTPLDEVYFPAIYVVNKNNIRKSVLMALAKDKLIENKTSLTELFHILVRSIDGRKLNETSLKIASGKFYSKHNFH